MSSNLIEGSLGWSITQGVKAETEADTAAYNVAAQAENIEDLLMTSYSLSDLNSKVGKDFKKAYEDVIGKELAADAKIEGVQQALQVKLQRAMAALQAFSQTLKDRFQASMEILRNSRTS